VPGVRPEDIIFFDDDLKTRAVATSFSRKGTPFWAYHDLVTEFKESGRTKPIDFYRMVMARVDEYHTEILEGRKPQPKAVIFDNWSRMETAIRAYSESIMSNISDLTPGQQKSMSQLTWTYTYEEYARVLGEIMKLAPMTFLTTHVKEKFMHPGVLESRGQRPIIEKSTFRVWLRHNPASPVPIGLVLKRIQRMEATVNGIEPVNVLPRKITPCNWATIYRYFDDPIGDRKPAEHEMPNEFELSILDGALTPDQKNALRVYADQVQSEKDAQLEEEKEAQDMAEAEMRSKVRAMKADGKSLPEIVKEFGGALSPGQVAGYLVGE
jgi:hypothetical protein